MKMDDCTGRRLEIIAEFLDSGDFDDLQRGVFGEGSQSSEFRSTRAAGTPGCLENP